MGYMNLFLPSSLFHSQHDDRAASEGGSGYYRRGGGGGRFRGGRGRWNRISFSPMRWEHDRFRSKSPPPGNEEGEGMADREDEAEEEEENDEEFLRCVCVRECLISVCVYTDALFVHMSCTHTRTGAR